MGIVLIPLIIIFVFLAVFSLLNTIRILFSESSPALTNEEAIGLTASIFIIPTFAVFLQIYDFVDISVLLKDRVCVQSLKLLYVYTFTISPLFLLVSLAGYLYKKHSNTTRHQAFFLGFLCAAFIYPLIIVFLGDSIINLSSTLFFNGKVISCFQP
jgi:hypothetical protein